MADLIDRISGESEPGRPKINSHLLIAAFRFYANGSKSRADIAAQFDLQGDEVTQAEALADLIDAQVGAQDKAFYIANLEGVAMCLEVHEDIWFHDAGVVDKAAVFAELGLG